MSSVRKQYIEIFNNIRNGGEEKYSEAAAPWNNVKKDTFKTLVIEETEKTNWMDSNREKVDENAGVWATGVYAEHTQDVRQRYMKVMQAPKPGDAGTSGVPQMRMKVSDKEEPGLTILPEDGNMNNWAATLDLRSIIVAEDKNGVHTFFSPKHAELWTLQFWMTWMHSQPGANVMQPTAEQGGKYMQWLQKVKARFQQLRTRKTTLTVYMRVHVVFTAEKEMDLAMSINSYAQHLQATHLFAGQKKVSIGIDNATKRQTVGFESWTDKTPKILPVRLTMSDVSLLESTNSKKRKQDQRNEGQDFEPASLPLAKWNPESGIWERSGNAELSYTMVLTHPFSLKREPTAASCGGGKTRSIGGATRSGGGAVGSARPATFNGNISVPMACNAGVSPDTYLAEIQPFTGSDRYDGNVEPEFSSIATAVLTVTAFMNPANGVTEEAVLQHIQATGQIVEQVVRDFQEVGAAEFGSVHEVSSMDPATATAEQIEKLEANKAHVQVPEGFDMIAMLMRQANVSGTQNNEASADEPREWDPMTITVRRHENNADKVGIELEPECRDPKNPCDFTFRVEDDVQLVKPTVCNANAADMEVQYRYYDVPADGEVVYDPWTTETVGTNDSFNIPWVQLNIPVGESETGYEIQEAPINGQSQPLYKIRVRANSPHA